MAQLCHDYEQFQALNTEVAVIVPNGPGLIERYVSAHAIPYPILSDRGSLVAVRYAVGVRDAVLITAMKPAVFLVDMSGKILYSNYLRSYIKEPDNREPLGVLGNFAG
jgi:peroxiredoxin